MRGKGAGEEGGRAGVEASSKCSTAGEVDEVGCTQMGNGGGKMRGWRGSTTEGAESRRSGST